MTAPDPAEVRAREVMRRYDLHRLPADKARQVEAAMLAFASATEAPPVAGMGVLVRAAEYLRRLGEDGWGDGDLADAAHCADALAALTKPTPPVECPRHGNPGQYIGSCCVEADTARRKIGHKSGCVKINCGGCGTDFYSTDHSAKPTPPASASGQTLARPSDFRCPFCRGMTSRIEEHRCFPDSGAEG